MLHQENNKEKRIELSKAARSYVWNFTWKKRALNALESL